MSLRILSLTTDKHFGCQLREERERQGLTQVEIAKRIGCRSDNISHFENGDNTFGNGSIKTVFKYSKALGYNEVNFKL